MELICCNNNKMPTPLTTSQTFHNPPQWVLNKYQRMQRLPNLSIKFSIIHLFLLLTLDELRWEKSGLWDSNTASGVSVCACMCQWATKSPLSVSVSVSPALGLHMGATLSHISVGAGEQTQVSTPVLQVDWALPTLWGVFEMLISQLLWAGGKAATLQVGRKQLSTSTGT